MSAMSRLRSRLADAYWEWKLGPGEPLTPERETRLLARVDQALADRRAERPMVVCDDPENCQPYGEHYRRLHGSDGVDDAGTQAMDAGHEEFPHDE